MNKKNIIVLVIILFAAIVGAGAFLSSSSATRPQKSYGSKANNWYTVHLNNGHVYFGHLASVTYDTITLADTFLMEVYTTPASQTASSTNFQLENTPQQVYNLTRRGVDSNMQTDNTLFIERRAVLFWEKLNADSKMAQWLDKAGAGK